MSMLAFRQYLAASLLFLVLPTAGFAREVADKLDERLGDQLDNKAEHVAVFVRMDDQLFAVGGDYEKFCAVQPPTTKRLELRKRVVRQLRKKAEDSQQAVHLKLKQLAATGSIRKLQHYWIVNGFACEANGEACRELADLPEVGFVYRQRFAPQHRTTGDHRSPIDAATTKLYRRLLAATSNDDTSGDTNDGAACKVPWNLQRIRADRAWAGTEDTPGVTGRGVVVAVLDSGLMSIPALMPALWKNPSESLNGKDDDANGYVDDVFGYNFQLNNPVTVAKLRPPHGTLCAGIIAGRPAGGDGARPIVTGVAPRSQIMPLVGNGQLRAYEYALTNGADVLSMSYTWDSQRLGHYRGLIRTAHEHLAAAGVVSVGGAGNYARSRPAGWQIGTPKDIPCVIAAAGIMQDGQVATASSRGPVAWRGVRYFDSVQSQPAKPNVTGCFGGYPMWTHVEAWEAAKRSRVQKIVQTDAEGYVLAIGPRGNSFSGPHAAGVAALMLEANPDLPVWRLQQLMESTCADLGEPGVDTTFGAGLLQADRAVAAALQ